MWPRPALAICHPVANFNGSRSTIELNYQSMARAQGSRPGSKIGGGPKKKGQHNQIDCIYFDTKANNIHNGHTSSTNPPNIFGTWVGFGFLFFAASI